jgi:hypothetical protein
MTLVNEIPIGQNRKRGRPNKTKKARQNENNSLSQRSSQTDYQVLQNLIIHHF